MQIVDCEELVRRLKEELKEANDKYNSANQRLADIEQLQADIERANVKVTVCVMVRFSVVNVTDHHVQLLSV